MRKTDLVSLLIFVTCCSLSISAARAQSSTVDYGAVTKVNQIDAGGGREIGTTVGALAGGVVGYQIGKGSTSGKKRRGIAAGSAAGGLLGNRAAKGRNKAYEYTVKLMDGNSVTITTEQGRIDKGDCVAIERGESANIRRVSEVHCQSEDSKATKEHLAEAKECEAAKAAMLDAETDEALTVAVRKARLLCEE